MNRQRTVPCFSSLVALILLVALSGSHYEAHGAVTRNQNQQTPITLDDYLEGKFGAQGFPGLWAPDSGTKVHIIPHEKHCVIMKERACVNQIFSRN